jgi:Na+/proline symporter/signal transduction histidine kinase
MLTLLILAAVAAYVAILFVVAARSDRETARDRRGRGWIYALSLAIYCTSWTYYGAVGTGARVGWEYLAIYIGPALGLTLLFPVWRRIAEAARRENIGSLADFISSRYGKSQSLGAVVALVAILGSLPYIALQLQSLSMAWRLVTAGTPAEGSEGVTVAVIATVLAGFTLLFGARRADLTEHNRGLIHAVALESVVKLTALLAVAGLAIALLLGAGAPAAAVRDSLGPLAAPPQVDVRFLTIVLLSTLAIFCLPRQFHVAFVEAAEPAAVRRARWVFPVYLLLTSLAVLPLVAAGGLFSAVANPDLYVLDLPFSRGAHVLTLVAFVGGFSAATAMVIVETVALAAMASNSLILPLLARRRRDGADPGMAGAVLPVRRLMIGVVLFLAWLYYQALDRNAGLASIGLISFAALAQMAPALFGAVLWRGGQARGALWGIVAGAAVWAVMLAWPQVGYSLGLSDGRPFGLEDPLPAGVALSLLVNLAVFVGVSRSVRPRLVDHVQARAFLDRGMAAAPEVDTASGVTAADLKALVARFIGEAGAARGFARLARERGAPLREDAPADAGMARAAERMLAGAVGASSARRVIAAALSGGRRDPEAVARMLDEASEAVQFNRDLLQATLDSIDQGVSVVDEDLRLIAWNRRYLEMFDLPVGFVHVGQPVAEVYRLNAGRGESPDDVEAWVERRLDALRRGAPHEHERARPDGRILRSNGAPLKGGGYVTSYTDITELRRAAEALAEANEALESRVADRTRRLAEAKQAAEAATASKTRFLAAASHDLLQPLHAARLFLAALREGVAGDPEARTLALNADRSIESAHGLLTALLDLSRLEAGGVQPAIRPVALGPVLEALAREFAPQARAKGLTLTVLPTAVWTRSDPDLLRSLLQNLIGNAVRYTRAGRVLVGCRRDGEAVRVMIADTGPGIPGDRLEGIFQAFARLPDAAGQPGAGLGLAIVRSVSELLDHPVEVRSTPGRGSTFTLRLPRAAPGPERAAPATPASPVAGLRVLCVDNEPEILEALGLLLARWGVTPVTAVDAAAALAAGGPFDAALVDLHLGDGPDGLAVVEALRARGLTRIAMVTADREEPLKARVRSLGAVLLPKPVRPAALKAFLSQRG